MRGVFGVNPDFLTIWREVNSRSLWITWAVTAFAVAVAGPFGTFEAQPFFWRLFYWGMLIAVAIVLSILIRTFWRNVYAGRQMWVENVVVSIGLAVLFGPFVIAMNRILIVPSASETLGVLPTMGAVFVIAMYTILVRLFLKESTTRTEASVEPDRLVTRLSLEDGVRVFRISSDNHHIRVFTSDGGEHRLLMRLRDAVTEVDVETGVYVHRSHWVALAAIVGVERDKGREFVRLSSGSALPVGPKFRVNLIEAGFISA